MIHFGSPVVEPQEPDNEEEVTFIHFGSPVSVSSDDKNRRNAE